MSRLFVRLGAPAVQSSDDRWLLAELTWVLLEDDGALISQGHGDGEALARLLERRALDEATRVILVLPTERSMLLELNVPGRSSGQIRRALPFVLEEYLASEIDDMHIAHGPIQRDQPIRCVAVERSLVAQWLAALTELDLSATAMLPEAALLQADADEINVLFDDSGVLVVSGAQSAVVDPDLLVMALSAAVTDLNGLNRRSSEDGEEGTDKTCVVTAINGQIPALNRAEIEQHFDGAITWNEDDTEVPALVYLARRWLATPSPLNLLHGEFAPPREIDPNWQKLRPVAVLAGVWFVLSVVLELGTAAWADYQSAGVTEEITALYRDYFPTERRVVDPYRQMAQHIGQTAGEGASFTQLLGQFAAGLAGGSTVSMRSVSFNANRNELSAELTIARFDLLDALKEALSKRGLQVEIASAEQQDDGIHARLRMRSG
jgi:general secretion pathway protein L